MNRWRLLLPGVWLGALLGVGAMAAPAMFALLAPAEAGRVVTRLFAQEAYGSLAIALLLLGLERMAAKRAAAAGATSQFSAGMALAAGALFCTVAGYFAVQPMMDAARAGQGSWTFAQLHFVSAGFFALKTVLVAALTWRASRIGVSPTVSS